MESHGGEGRVVRPYGLRGFLSDEYEGTTAATRTCSGSDVVDPHTRAPPIAITAHAARRGRKRTQLEARSASAIAGDSARFGA